MKTFSVCIALAFVHAAATADCADNFVERTLPHVVAETAVPRTHLLCFSSYAVLESGQTRTGIWSAERLTRENVERARGLQRESHFHSEESIPERDRAELVDYKHSDGYDRGHLTPSGDQGDTQSQGETFTLANVIPQASRNNRQVWEHIEYATRLLAKRAGTIYIVTGPAYTSAVPRYLNGRVRIPDLIWKAVYIPSVGTAAYLVRNDSAQRYAVASLVQIARLSGIDPFPTLPPGVKGSATDLPTAVSHKGRR
jgi:endonuclease G